MNSDLSYRIISFKVLLYNYLMLIMRTLHEAMVAVLKQNRRPMKAAEIAQEINRMKLYERGDRQPVPGSQISARANNYPLLFEKEDGMIRLV